MLIPQSAFEPTAAQANGRALAYLAHELPRRRLRHRLRHQHDPHPLVRRRLGDGGAAEHGAALPAALRHGARTGRAPTRPLVLVFTAIAFVVTLIFHADVDAQGGAYATGVLVLMTSASVAVTLSAWRQRPTRRSLGFGVIALVFVYTTVVNILERPGRREDRRLFIVAIVVVSLVSRRLARRPSCASSGGRARRRRRGASSPRRPARRAPASSPTTRTSATRASTC